MPSQTQAAPVSKSALWTGRILTVLIVLFLFFDGITKVLQERHIMAAAAQMGFSAGKIVGVGATLLICLVIYVIPRTATLGAILLTGYLGGAIATQVFVGRPLVEALFPGIFGVLVWAGIYLRDVRIRALIPFQS